MPLGERQTTKHLNVGATSYKDATKVSVDYDLWINEFGYGEVSLAQRRDAADKKLTRNC